METKESLLAKNKVFDRDHGLRDSDLELCNYLIGVIESTRSDKEPRAGDRIECIGPNAEYLFGHLEQPIKEEYCAICTQPYTSFVGCNSGGEENIFPKFNTSGGYWLSCTDPKMYEYKGKTKKIFKCWGNAGWTAGGAVKFEAEVSLWRLFKKSIY